MTRRRTTPPSARPEAAPTTFTADGRPVVRCAIYTRQSVSRGEQEFTSCEAQRERGEDYVRAMKYEGWTVLDERFDDLGRSGGTLERPALRQLLSWCAQGRVDALPAGYSVDVVFDVRPQPVRPPIDLWTNGAPVKVAPGTEVVSVQLSRDAPTRITARARPAAPDAEPRP